MSKFFVLEGIDGAGKTTIRNKVITDLRAKSVKTLVIGQHSWLDPFSSFKIVNLRENRSEYDIHEIGEAYFIDKCLMSSLVMDRMLLGSNVLADRYIFSDAVYHDCLYSIPFQSTIEKYINYGIRLPEIIFYVTTELQTSIKRINSRTKQVRHYEKEVDLYKVYKKYDELFEYYGDSFGRIVRINNCDGASIEELSDIVLKNIC